MACSRGKPWKRCILFKRTCSMPIYSYSSMKTTPSLYAKLPIDINISPPLTSILNIPHIIYALYTMQTHILSLLDTLLVLDWGDAVETCPFLVTFLLFPQKEEKHTHLLYPNLAPYLSHTTLLQHNPLLSFSVPRVSHSFFSHIALCSFNIHLSFLSIVALSNSFCYLCTQFLFFIYSSL